MPLGCVVACTLLILRKWTTPPRVHPRGQGCNGGISCKGVWNPGPSEPQIIVNEYDYLALSLVNVSDLSYFFSARGWGKGVWGARRGGGGGFFLWKSQEGGGCFQEGEGPGGCLWRTGEFWGGGGAKYFFSGPKRPLGTLQAFQKFPVVCFPKTDKQGILALGGNWPSSSIQTSRITLPSDTKLLLTKNYSEIIIFGKLRISRVISWKCLYFMDISRARNPSKITKNNSPGNYFRNNFVSEGNSGESNRPLTPILLKSIAIHLPFLSRYFGKNMPSSWQKVLYTPPIRITIRLPFVSRYFLGSSRVRGCWNTPK